MRAEAAPQPWGTARRHLPPRPRPLGAASASEQISGPGCWPASQSLPSRAPTPAQGLFSRHIGSNLGPWFPPGRIPELGFWVADGIFQALAPSQAGSWVNAALQAPGGVVR